MPHPKSLFSMVVVNEDTNLYRLLCAVMLSISLGVWQRWSVILVSQELCLMFMKTLSDVYETNPHRIHVGGILNSDVLPWRP